MQEGATINVVFDPLKAFGSIPTRRAAIRPVTRAKQTMVYDSTNHVYRMTEPDGTFWEFYDFTQPTLPQGLFKRRVYPRRANRGSDQLQRFPDSAIATQQCRRSGPFEQYDYLYGTAGGGRGQLTSITLSRCNTTGGTMTAVRQVSYTYYASGDPAASRAI